MKSDSCLESSNHDSVTLITEGLYANASIRKQSIALNLAIDRAFIVKKERRPCLLA